VAMATMGSWCLASMVTMGKNHPKKAACAAFFGVT
jgi:hypothetical protein